MSIKLDTLSDWKLLEKPIGLYGEEIRRVKIYFNCEDVTPLYITCRNEAPRFLTTVPYGLSTLEFWAEGELQIYTATDEPIVYWQSTEDELQVFEGDGESFTTIHERQPRNEALEWVQYQSEMNMKRMQADLQAQMDQRLAVMEAEYGTKAGIHGGASAQPQEPEISTNQPSAVVSGAAQAANTSAAPSGSAVADTTR